MSEPVTYRRALQLAVPASIASLITPILGLTDAAVLGYSPRPLDVGAVGLAAAIFSLLFWTFGFLRMSTAGLTAQAIGSDDEALARRTLAQSVALGALIGLILVVLQKPLGDLCFWFMTRGTSVVPETISAADDYYVVRIWGAPFVLAASGMMGWLTARGRTDMLMVIAVLTTSLNAGLDALFVLYYDLGAAGIAIGTLIAEIFSACLAALAIVLLLRRSGGLDAHWQGMDYFSVRALKRLLSVNLDIFIRTFILSVSYVYFIQRSGVFGDLTLSANQVLMQFFLVTGLALDGPAIAAETLVGQALGRKSEMQRRREFRDAVLKTSIIGAVGAFLLCGMYFVLDDILLDLVAPDPAINTAAREYFIWIALSPLAVAAAFQFDGIYIGATRSRALRNSMIVSALLYLLMISILTDPWGNHGLWVAFLAYMLVRAATLALAWPGFAFLLEQGQKEGPA
ncbi:MAG: MATE family efflux transporter [Aquisalinus sp.]|nr:MATE family efflux transporter [Aquisalinus sp.]